jgi:molybdopterin synthase sulfur carrier subunit
MGASRKSKPLEIRVKFFSFLREIFGFKERAISLPSGANLKALLDEICDSKERRSQMFKNSELNPALIVMKNGKSISGLSGLETDLQEGDVIAIFPFTVGG